MNKPWYEYTDPKNRFSVSFLQPPTVETDSFRGAGNEEYVIETIGHVEQRNTLNREFAVTISNIPMIYRSASRNAYYSDMKKDMKANGKNIFFQELSAFDIKHRDNNQHIHTVYVVDKEFKLLYMIMTAGSEAFINSPEAKRFFESFRFTS